jgi:hypothetical protein
MEEYQCDGSYLKHFNLLVDFIKDTYASTTERFTALLEDHEITYDLLDKFKAIDPVWAEDPVSRWKKGHAAFRPSNVKDYWSAAWLLLDSEGTFSCLYSLDELNLRASSMKPCRAVNAVPKVGIE